MKENKTMTPKEIQLINKQIGMFMGWTVEIYFSEDFNKTLRTHARTVNYSTNTVHHSYVPFGRTERLKSRPAVVRDLWQQLCNDVYGDCGKYHLDWHQLMQVIDRVETKNNGLDGILGSGTTPLMVRIERLDNPQHDYRCSIIFNQHSRISVRSENRLEAVWLAMGEFAKEYNFLTLTGEYRIMKPEPDEENNNNG